MKIVVASSNSGKIKEFKELLSPLGFEIISKKQAGVLNDVEETGNSFAENAKIKALAIFNVLNLPTLADDSGLEVDALNGAPGIYSARYSKKATAEENNKKLLEELQNIKNRKARFVCALCFINSNGEIFEILKTVEGEIAKDLKGKNGFGYDPLFLYNGESFGDMPSYVKNKISHRGKAIKELVLNIKKWI